MNTVRRMRCRLPWRKLVAVFVAAFFLVPPAAAETVAPEAVREQRLVQRTPKTLTQLGGGLFSERDGRDALEFDA